MKLLIDTEAQSIRYVDGHDAPDMPLYSNEGFDVLSQLWSKVAWNQKYTYTFSWLGRPVIQLPADLIRIQEVIHRIKPDVIIETGVAHGGSLVFYASICKAMNQGRVIGIDIHIRPHNRQAIESHGLSDLITLIEGSSVDPQIVARVQSLLSPEDTVLVLLDSCHSKQHVLDELRAYGQLVTPGSYLVATDGVMQDLSDVPRGHAEWKADNPCAAVQEFVAESPEFCVEEPGWPFNESTLQSSLTHWPGAWLRRGIP